MNVFNLYDFISSKILLNSLQMIIYIREKNISLFAPFILASVLNKGI